MFRRVQQGVALAGLTVMLSGCATMYVRGNHLRTVRDDEGEKVPLRVMNFDNATRDLRVFEGDRELLIMAVPDNVVENNFKNYVRQQEARSQCGPGVCRYSWEETSEYGPGLWLDPRRPHTLRLERNGEAAVVTVKASFKPKWLFANWVWFTFAPVGWVVDGTTGSWKEFPRLDINDVFLRARRSEGRGAR
jgi:hypothetical protein